MFKIDTEFTVFTPFYALTGKKELLYLSIFVLLLFCWHRLAENELSKTDLTNSGILKAAYKKT